MSTAANTIQVQVNGEGISLPAGATCADVLGRLGVDEQQRFAVEVNETIVPHSQLREHRLAEGDRVEVIQAIGGG
ncbi:MAG: sulfur carrier protein ThiS [Halorhodospira sp.]